MSEALRKHWIEALQQLADDPEEFDNQGGDVVFVRQGKEHNLCLREKPGAGLCVVREIGDVKDYIPIEVYVQRDLLELPRLAQQIQKTLDRLAQKRVAGYIDGPAMFEVDGSAKSRDRSSDNLKLLLCESEPGVTNLLQLMAPAGHGKTVLLEEVAQGFAKTYEPQTNPFPIVLLVDLLGRFVGNIDDAIAGAINNTYNFPSLTQRDVIVAMRNRWLTLALDGFDELVARIGPKDAFLRISDLLDQVDGAGSIIISARESFFELHRITVAIRSYLQPKRGSFKTSIVRLQPWTVQQGIEVFRQLGSKNPESDLKGLTTAFADDLIAFQPFFLTRLAELWQKGERFSSATGGSQLNRIKYVVGRLLEREANEKWRDSKGNQILSFEEHELILCTVAEEMFRTGAFFLRLDEVRLAAQFALEESKKTTAVVADAIERFPTHAFIQSTDRGYRFSHDKFLHYFLGIRLATLCISSPQDFLTCIKAKELAPEIIEWLIATLPNGAEERLNIATKLLSFVDKESEIELLSNIGTFVPQLLHGVDCRHQLEFTNAVFAGDGLRGLNLHGINFKDCTFTAIDVSDTVLSDCVFLGCKFDSIVISEKTALPGCVFSDSKINALNLHEKDRSFYSPREIAERITLLGAKFDAAELIKEHVLADDISTDVVEVVEKLIRASHKGWDICVEEFVEKWGSLGEKVIEEGLQAGILRAWNRDVGGPRRHFVRFQVDRNLLLTSLRDAKVDPTIEKFWRAVQ